MSAAPRVAIVGARNVRQGLGPWVARDLRAAGLDVVAVLGTREATAAAAASELGERLGRALGSYTDVRHLLEREAVDALVILSPAETHEPYLRAALEAGVHVLCEKPLIWGGSGLAERAEHIVSEFRARGLLLAENCQWPWTLPAYRELHPDAPAGAPRHFMMWLSPSSTGEAQITDCISHPLSLLQALAPHPEAQLEAVQARAAGPSGTDLGLVWRAGDVRLAVQIELRQHPAPPRPAGYALDGRRAERRVQMPEYRMEFADGARRVPVPDPLTARLADFAAELDAVRGGAPAADPAPLARRMALAEQVLEAYRAQVDGAGN